MIALVFLHLYFICIYFNVKIPDLSIFLVLYCIIFMFNNTFETMVIQLCNIESLLDEKYPRTNSTFVGSS